MTTGPAPMCIDCEHWNEEDQEGFTCKAFPKGIPQDIIDGKVEHYESYKGDNGFQFKQKE